MRKCYFCGTTKGLKCIWVEDDDAPEGQRNSCCCFSCFNDPDSGMEESPVSGTDWAASDYNWNHKK